MTGPGSIYGQALYDLASDEKLTEEIGQQLQVLRDCFQAEPNFIRLLGTASLSKEERCRILDETFREKVHPYLLNFLKILTEKGYIRHFGECCQEYTRLYHEERGIVPVTAVTAVALSPAQAQRLTAALEKSTGKTISLRNRIDPAVLGGVRLDYDGKRLDDTLAHRLDSIRSVLNSTVL